MMLRAELPVHRNNTVYCCMRCSAHNRRADLPLEPLDGSCEVLGSLSRPRYASIALAGPPRFAERVTYETASNPSNIAGSKDKAPSPAR
jgi:hypothetical protein